MKKLTINQVVIWVTQAAVIGFTLPTIFGFFISPNGMLTLDGSYFLFPVIIGLIGFSILGESIATIVMGITAVILLVMLLCVVLFKKALKYGVFLFAVILLDLTTMFAWYKVEIFEGGHATTNFIVHLLLIALLIAGMYAAFKVRFQRNLVETEMEDRAEAEVEFEVESKLLDPQETVIEDELIEVQTESEVEDELIEVQTDSEVEDELIEVHAESEVEDELDDSQLELEDEVVVDPKRKHR